MLPHDLDAAAVRVLGALIEKELSTPDHYPLSLNALTGACNQLSNRDPVMTLDEGAVSAAIDDLRRRGLVRSIQGVGSRVQKYQHLLAEAAEFSRAELAVLCVLALRGAQTLAEIRARAARLMPGGDAGGIEAAVESLVSREPQPVATRVARRPGQKEGRYSQLLGGEVVEDGAELPAPATAGGSPDRIAALEEAMREFRDELADLRAQLAAFRRQFE